MNKGTKQIFDQICKVHGATYIDNLKNPVKEMKDHIVMYVLYKGNPYECLLDKSDIKIVARNNTWLGSINGSKDKIYVVSAIKHRVVKLHRLLTKCPSNKVVDHINGNTFDNRRSNIRVCTTGVNMLNKKQYNTNKTGTTNIINYKGNYKLSIIRQFNDISLAQRAKQEIQQIIDHYSNLDAANR